MKTLICQLAQPFASWHAGMKSISCSAALVGGLLAGCATQPPTEPPKVPVTVPVEVKVPVPVPCRIELPSEPQWGVDAEVAREGQGAVTDDLARSKAILVELEQRRDWLENKVKPAIKKCQ